MDLAWEMLGYGLAAVASLGLGIGLLAIGIATAREAWKSW